MIGKQILHYLIKEKLGEGGMGIVYLAEDTKLDRKVAIKFLPPHVSRNINERKRFEIEAKSAASLNHQNISHIYAIEEVNDEMFIVMEYIEGEELKERILKDPITSEMAINIASQIAEGLKAAHSKGIVHRDIKSSNIMITEENKVKIMDFGLAKVRGGVELTKEHSTLGTAAYMSPEQAHGEDVDHRTDIWSFGIVLYEMLTGSLPFKGDYEQAVIYSILNENHPSLREKDPEIPKEVEKLINRMLEKNKEKRYQDLEGFLSDLEFFQNGESENKAVLKTKPLFQFSKTGWYIIFVLIISIMVFAFFLMPRDLQKETIPESTIVVTTFEYNGDKNWDWLSLAVTDMINTNLSKYSSLRLASSHQLMRTKKKLDLTNKKINIEQALQIAQETNSENLITGVIEKNGEHLLIRAKIFETSSKKITTEIEPVSGNTNGLNVLVEKLSSSIFRNMPKKVKFTSTKNEPIKHIPLSLDAYRYYLEGRNAVSDQRHNDAIENLKRSIDLDPEYVDSYYWLAHEYSILGDDQKASEILKEGKSYISQLSEEERLRYLSNEAGIENRWTDYANYLEKLLKINPFDPIDHARYGWTLYKKFRKIDSGIRELEKAIELDSTYSWAYNTLGYAYLEKGEKQKALSMLNKYISLNPTDIDPLDSKAEIQFYIGEYKQAIKNCDLIMAIKPDHYSSNIILIRILIAQGKYSQAIIALNKFMGEVKNLSYKSEGYSSLSQILFLQNNYDDALINASKAIELDSSNLEAHWMLARILLNLNKTKLLENEIVRIENALFNQGGLDKRWLLYQLKGEIAFVDKNYPEAIDWFEKAINLWPRDRSFYLTNLANSYLHSGKFSEAEKYYTKALKFNSNNAVAALGLAQNFEKMNHKQKAIETYQQFLQIWNMADRQIHGLEFAQNKIKDLN
jgi:serine/threonine protein kinase/Flp pilus assembly protein TadD